MRTIGLLGGMSWKSSVEYERIMNQEVQRRLGGTHSADLIVRSYNFAVVERLQADGDWAAAGQRLADDARHLERAGAEAIVLCTNTMHRVAPAIEAAIGVPFLHLADATAEAIKNAGLSRVGLLGTRFTMEADFYRGRLTARHGLQVDVPPPGARQRVHDVIYAELVQGRIEDASRHDYVQIVEGLVAEGAQGIIAGCTEIEQLLRPEDISVPLFATARIHALAAVDFALDS